MNHLDKEFPVGSPKRVCFFCHEEVNPDDPSLWKQVVGWVRGPKKDSMRLRQDTTALAHDTCVKRIMEGQTVDQPDITEESDERHFVSDDELPDDLR